MLEDDNWLDQWSRRWRWRKICFWGAALYSLQETALVLSDRGLLVTVGGGAATFFLSGSFSVTVAVLFCCCCCVVVSSFTAVVVGQRCVALCH